MRLVVRVEMFDDDGGSWGSVEIQTDVDTPNDPLTTAASAARQAVTHTVAMAHATPTGGTFDDD